MKKYSDLKETGFRIDDDLTEREKQIQKWLECIEKEERESRLDTKVGCMKIRVEGIWHEWEKKGVD